MNNLLLLPPCAGIIVINKNELDLETILVCTDHDNYSFPKGKRNKGESVMEGALRELQEETGLTFDDIKIVSNITIDELSNNGGLATRYFVATLITDKRNPMYDETELKKVEWIKISDVFELYKFKDRRKEILKKAISYI